MTIEISLPQLHPDQVRAFRLFQANRFVALRGGRRWGKTDFAKTIACDGAVKGQPIGWFAPDYKIEIEAFNEIAEVLAPVRLSSSKVEGVIRTTTGGRIDFWTLENERAGRSRKYKKVLIDEAAFTKPGMMAIWEQSIRPTLLDLNGKALVLSNTNGNDPENFFWRICTQPNLGFVEFHAPTSANPHIPLRLPGETEESLAARRAEVLEKLRTENHPLVYRQEYLAEFVDWSGGAFFDIEKLLVDGRPVEAPNRCDAVFAVIDTAIKTGKDNDGTGVAFWAVDRIVGHPLVLLDWDIIQIEGASLETWLPTVFERLETFARSCHARMGTLGAFIEDKGSGTILLQQARRRGWMAQEIESKLTAMGKDERALSVSRHVHCGSVKFSVAAYDKVSIYKGVSRNHMCSQVAGFRMGDTDNKRADDLLDCFCYGIALTLGDSGGMA